MYVITYKRQVTTLTLYIIVNKYETSIHCNLHSPSESVCLCVCVAQMVRTSHQQSEYYEFDSRQGL